MLLQALGTVKSPTGPVRVLAIALGTDLTKDPRLLRVLSDLSAVIESRTLESFPESLDAEVEEWFETHSNQAHLLFTSMPDAILDAIARAVEQAESVRQETTTAKITSDLSCYFPKMRTLARRTVD